MALKNDGTVVAWGANARGQTDVPVGLTDVQMIAAGSEYTVALKTDGTVVAWGGDLRKVPEGLKGVQTLAAGGFHTVALVNPAVAFGNQFSGTTSGARTFKIKNTGTATLSLASVSLHGVDAEDFTVKLELLSDTLPENSGESTFTIAFTPGSLGEKNATLRVVSNDSEEPIYNIPLTGTAIFHDTAITTGTKATDIDVLANDPAASRSATVFTFPAPPQAGTVRVIAGKIRYLPRGALPLAGDTFVYHYDDSAGHSGTGPVTVANFTITTGEYDGLIRPETPGIDNAARHRQSGYQHLSLTKTGVFSAALTFGGTKLIAGALTNSVQYSFLGRLDSAGNSVSRIARRGLPPITLTIHFDAETRTISGTAESLDGTIPFASQLTLAKRTPAGPLARTHPVKIIPDGTLGTAGESGIARVRIAASGNVIIFGRLGDGAAFSTSAFLHADQTFPLYAVLYDGNATTRGSLRGNIQLPGSQTTDSLEWFKPARPRDTLFPGGFVVNAGMAFDAVRQ